MSKSSSLVTLRKKVEKIDGNILKLLEKRFQLTDKIQTIKKVLGIPLLQKEREAYLLKKYHDQVRHHPRLSAFVQKAFRILFSYSKKNGRMKGR